MPSAPAGRRSLFVALGILAIALLVLAVMSFLLLRKPSPPSNNKALVPSGHAVIIAITSTVSITATATVTGEIGAVTGCIRRRKWQ